MNIIKYSQLYENDVVELWNNCCYFDPISISKFRKQIIFDENFRNELAYVAIEDDIVIGFILGTKRKFPYLERGLEPDRGWINVIFVDKKFRRKGVAQALYEKIENNLRDLGCKNITLGAYSPNYFFWGLDPLNYTESIKFFEKNGYISLDKHYSMCKDLHGFVIPESTKIKINKAVEKGYKFVNFTYDYSLKLLDFLYKEFGAGWKRNALISMQNGRAEDCIILALDDNNDICGFCMREIDGNPMRFGPVGVSREERNHGIGTILLDLQCFEMTRKGIYHMFFITTDENGKRYYERNGLSVFRYFVVYRKDI